MHSQAIARRRDGGWRGLIRSGVFIVVVNTITVYATAGWRAEGLNALVQVGITEERPAALH